jgi:hypothetical protein
LFRSALFSTTTSFLPAVVLLAAFGPANKLNHLPEMVRETTYMT